MIAVEVLCFAALVLLLVNLYRFITLFVLLYDIYKKISYLPGPKGHPVLKNYLESQRPEKIIGYLMNHVRTYGGIFRYDLFIYLGGIVITDCKIAETILSSMEILDKALTYGFLSKWLGNGLATANGERWKKTRKILNPAFHSQILEQYVVTFDSVSNCFIKMLRKKATKDPFDVYPLVKLYALDIICETAMGTKINAQENSNSEYVRVVKEMRRIMMDRTTSPLKQFENIYYFSRDYWKEKRNLKFLHGFTNSVIKKRREELINNRRNDLKPKRKMAFIDLILEATIDGRPMTDDEIRQEVDTFIFAGHDTSASGIAFTLYCLSKYPDVQEKIIEEMRNIFGDDRNKVITYKDLQEMKYLEMVIKEALRLYPPVPVYSRQPNSDFSCYKGILPANSQIGFFPFGVHRNPEYYPNPEKFDPERFSPENQLKRPPFSYLVFSGGPRNCIGKKFSMLEMKMTVSKVLMNFEILPVEDFEPKLSLAIVLVSLNGIVIKLKEREW